MGEARTPETSADGAGPEPTTAMVRVDALREFTAVVAELGGDAAALLTKANVDPAVLSNRHAVIPYRTLMLLLERAAAALDRPDFGMRLAMAQGGLKILGPLEFAMRNSRTLREAYRYCAEHLQVYSLAMRMTTVPGPRQGEVFYHYELLLPKLPVHTQTIERAMLLSTNLTRTISSGQVRVREVWFTHEPLSSPDTYRGYFGTDVRFGQPMNGILLDERDLDFPLPNVDPQLYAIATDFIEDRFPAGDTELSARSRSIIERLLLEGNCTYNGVAAMLGLHPRTLQRRLKAEGASFEAIKDDVRRDIALRYLRQSTVPLVRIARMLGYSDTSALARSCFRWFDASPSQLRGGSADESSEIQPEESA